MDLIPNWVPNGYKTVTPMLVVKDAEKALRFYNSVFGAETTMMLKSPEGALLHGEFRIFDSSFMITEDTSHNPDPLKAGGTSVIIHLYAGDAEEIFEAAEREGAKIIFPLEEQFYGDKAGRFEDPFGHQWIISRRLEDLTPEMIQKKFHAMISQV